ncbi:helix-turn-helix domain-containing protein [Bosea sp. BK604]|uniref:helix-turn-helix domain-containing protein n=1 Tax=Bosea sp. BK604 TaxID=2512180 RepID=UPI0010512A61|nr:helix-turn-helix domain-containing protein [Bosea sp. BK604]TCR60955.1 Homeodomain-like domain-containing protein [Bosea sp. BK604]
MKKRATTRGTRARPAATAGRPIPTRHRRQIAALAAEGMSTREIAEQIGISPGTVRRIAKVYAIPLALRGSRYFGFELSRRTAKKVEAKAAEAGVSPAVIVDELLEDLLNKGEDYLMSRLGMTKPVLH